MMAAVSMSTRISVNLCRLLRHLINPLVTSLALGSACGLASHARCTFSTLPCTAATDACRMACSYVQMQTGAATPWTATRPEDIAEKRDWRLLPHSQPHAHCDL